jgi:hypothetical protein
MRENVEQRIGREQDLDDLNRWLRDYVHAFGAPVVGAMHITCADESEFECGESFQRHVVNHLLPRLKFGCRAAFRLANLGGRYEPGALAVAEHHFATPETRDAFKVLLIKINAHVAVDGHGESATFGRMQRYDTESTACGALHALLAGAELPAVAELRSLFERDDVDRVGQLLDPQQVPPEQRSLFVALANARLQARRVEDDIQTHGAHSPTVYVVAAAVTFNRPGRDTELLCGLTTVDQRQQPPTTSYVGLGDLPARYRLGEVYGRVQITET